MSSSHSEKLSIADFAKHAYQEIGLISGESSSWSGIGWISRY